MEKKFNEHILQVWESFRKLIYDLIQILTLKFYFHQISTNTFVTYTDVLIKISFQ